MNGVQPHLERDDRLSMNKLQCHFLMTLQGFHCHQASNDLKTDGFTQFLSYGLNIHCETTGYILSQITRC